MTDKITQELTTISEMMKNTLDKYDIVAKNYQFMYEDLAKEIFKKGMIVGYNKALKKARWTDEGESSLMRYCSNCHYGVFQTSPYCPNCGAKMKGIRDEN